MPPEAFRAIAAVAGRCDPRLRAWSGGAGVLLAVTTWLSMLASEDWTCWLVLTDPRAWMMLILAAAAGVSVGYALGCWLRDRRAVP